MNEDLLNGTMEPATTGQPADPSRHQELGLGHLDTQSYVFLSTTVLMSTTSLSLNLAMGCILQPDDFRRQWNTLGGTFAGALLQYVVFPTMAYVLCHLLAVPGPFSIGVMLLASCPGSPVTGLVTYFINGDVCLSLCLSAVCSAVSIGLAPAILFLYTRSWTYQTLHIALWPLAVTLLLQTIPPFIGYLIKRQSAEAGQLTVKIFTVLGVLSFITDSIMQIVAHHGLSWHSAESGDSHTSGGLVTLILTLPGLAWLTAYVLAAWLFRQNVWKRRTLCAEILVHNVSLATVILGSTFHTFHHKAEVAAVLSFSNLVSGVYALLVIVAYNVRAPWTKSGKGGLLRVQDPVRDSGAKDKASGAAVWEDSSNVEEPCGEQCRTEGVVKTLHLPMSWGPVATVIIDDQEDAQGAVLHMPETTSRVYIKVTQI